MSILNNTNLLNSLLEQANNLPDAGGGEVELPELTNPATGSQILSGYEAINENGEVITGTIATKTSSNLTASGATVTVPAGYYASQATKSVGTATQATPSVSVNSSGLITASATQSAGYVSAGTKSGTKQLTTQAAKTVTPSTSSQTAVASGVYTTGAVTVAAIPDNYIVDSELSAQDSLIAQIQSAVENLPDAGSGESGGTSVPSTCTVITSSNSSFSVIYSTVDENGEITTSYTDVNASATTHTLTVVCGSYIFIPVTSNIPGYNINGNAIFIKELGRYMNDKTAVFKITATSNETVTINCYDDD